jgi:phosphate transporter
MFGSGMLTEVDFNSLSWHTLFLVGGGNVLGKAVQVSGLLEYLADGIIDTLPLRNPWLALVFILSFVLTISIFVSHTVASIILMPIIARIGVSLQIPEVVVIGSAFAVSGAMALPFSSFPNVNSLLIVDDFQKPYLSVGDFVQTGLPMSIITVLLISSVGFAIINLCF